MSSRLRQPVREILHEKLQFQQTCKREVYNQDRYHEIENRFLHSNVEARGEENTMLENSERRLRNDLHNRNEQIKEMAEEGVEAIPLPPKPIDRKKIN